MVYEYILDSLKLKRIRRSIVRKGIDMYKKEGSVEKLIQQKK
jgi:hypothetical protein